MENFRKKKDIKTDVKQILVQNTKLR